MAEASHIKTRRPSASGGIAFYNNPKVRSALWQIALLGALLWLGYQFAVNAHDNLRAQKIASGFGFLNNTAGFGVNQALISYDETDSYGRIFVVGLLNTLLVSALGIALATPLGFVVGIARLSSNWLIARLAGAYVELLRNLPLLLQILFWYMAVLGALPGPRESVTILRNIHLSNRGIVLPQPVFGDGAQWAGVALGVGIAAAVGVGLWARRRQRAGGRRLPVFLLALALIVLPPLIMLAAQGMPVSFQVPQLRGFNFVGGVRVIPEFAALLIALATYTASFIAEIVRAGILSVPHGQAEAAYSLGLRPGATLRLIVVPQALRLIVPPLTSQYLNLTKNSSLAVAIGYPDLFAVFAGTTLNQTGQAIEILAMTMAVYLTISLLTSALMHWYNSRIRPSER